MKEELLNGLSEEQIAKVKACKNQEEIIAFAKQEGIELTDEQLEAVSGGGCSTQTSPVPCDKCGCNRVRARSTGDVVPITTFTCTKCGYTWVG